MRAGGYTSTRGEASRGGGGSEGFFRGARYFYFFSLVGIGPTADAGRDGQERSVSYSTKAV